MVKLVPDDTPVLFKQYRKVKLAQNETCLSSLRATIECGIKIVEAVSVVRLS